jgi:ADP-heptose:LPS heptosyltransferase
MRSLPDTYAAELRAGLPGTIVSLEPNESGASDMADTAAIMEQLDLIVSVDTSVGHLAGALGKPCSLLVPGFAPDWRWMQARTDSPWYPRHRIYRGDVDGNWEAAVARLIADAKAAAASVKSSPVPGKVSPNPVAQLLFRAEALRRETRYSEALDMARRAVKLVPDNAGPHSVLGTLLADVGRLKEAEQFERRAVALAPDYPAFRHDLALNLLAQGRYREAWPLYTARAEVQSLNGGFPRQVPSQRWRGESLEGKHIVILPEQGFGDQIQFFRFIPELQKRGGRITLFAKSPLISLFEANLPGVEVRSASGTVQLGRPDYWTTLVDMAGPLDVTLDSLTCPPYLHTDRLWPELPEGFNVGLCTSGNPRHPNDIRRSLAPEAATRLRAALPGHVIGLDPAESGARDFADSAALVQRLDLVVSVDTSIAHLAGALGKPVLLLVPGLATDWRWMRERDDSPWYPSHRLYRGALDGSWSAAIDRLLADAHDLASGKG